MPKQPLKHLKLYQNKIMQIHELKSKKDPKKRVGRGGRKGTYSGKGQKGQKSRAGARFQPLIREWLKRYHKLRGYRFGIQEDKAINFNLSDLEKLFESGEVVSIETLFEKKLVKKTKGKNLKIKILAKGNLTKSLIIEDCIVSKKAKEIIEKQKGQIK